MPDTSLDITSLIDQKNPVLFRHIFNHVQLGMVLVDNSDTIRSINPYAANMLGYAEEELLGKSILFITHPDDVKRTKESQDAFRLSQENEYQLQKNYLKKSGETLQAEVNVSKIQLAGDEPFYLATIADIGAALKKERKILRSERKFKAMFNSSFEIIILTNPFGKIIDINDTASKYLGIEKEEASGNYLWELKVFDGMGQRILRLKSALRLARKGGIVRDQQEYSNSRGHWFFDISFQPIITDQDAVDSVIIEARDITKMVAAQSALAENEQFYSSIIRNTPGYLVTVFDPSLIITFAEGPALAEAGLSKDLVEGRRIPDLIDNPILSEKITHDLTPVFDNKFISFERSINNESYYIKAFPMESDEEGIKAGVAIVQNITEIKHAQESLNKTISQLDITNEELQLYIESNLELEQFAYVASHDLREPLRTINGFSQILVKKYSDQLDERGKNYLDFISKATVNMDRLINDLLAYSRVGTDKALLEEINTEKLLGEIVGTLQKQIDENNVTIHIGELPEKIVGYRTKLIQVIQNLVSNAIKFKKPEIAPEIEISAHSNGGYWEFNVKDNGIGMEEKYFDRIFVLFKRLHDRETYDGTGLGLAICKRIIDQHRGRIWVESKLDEGSTFSFTIKKALEN